MKNIICIMLVAILPFSVMGQKKAHKKKTAHKETALKMGPSNLPVWAAAHNYDAKTHAYFPDYYTYYDPQRGGYVFWKDGQYSFTPTVPPFLEKVDMSKERVQILKGLSLDLHPETDYPRYMKLYPAVNGNDMVPVPSAPGQ